MGNTVRTDIYLRPGDIFISGEPATISTVLGSCVSVTMFNQEQKIGAICHNLLPVCKDKSRCRDNCPQAFRYVECTITRMVKEFTSRGIYLGDIEVKLFGGADMFNVKISNTGPLTVGKQNIETALRILSETGLRISASDTGGSEGRKIIFHTHTGKVLLKRLNRIEMKKYGNE